MTTARDYLDSIAAALSELRERADAELEEVRPELKGADDILWQARDGLDPGETP